MRSTEVARASGSFGRPDKFGSSYFAQIVDFSCSIDLYGSWELILDKIRDPLGFRGLILLKLWIF